MKIFCYKISKYNPKNYKDGAYQLDEWTDFSDIGKVFESGIFTMEEYLKVEKNYIDFILKVVKEKKINSFYNALKVITVHFGSDDTLIPVNSYCIPKAYIKMNNICLIQSSMRAVF